MDNRPFNSPKIGAETGNNKKRRLGIGTRAGRGSYSRKDN